MFGRSKSAPAIPPAADMVEGHVQAMSAQALRNQQQFDKWIERTLVPAVNRYFEASKKGQYLTNWTNHSYGSTFVSTCYPDRGVRVTTFVGYIYPVLEERYCAAGYRAFTEEITEEPVLNRNLQFTGEMRQLSRPMYVTTIIFGRHP